MENQIKKIIFGFLWRFFERSSVQGVRLIVFILLARLLTPEAFGLIAFTAIFITLSEALITNGLGASLIQSKKIDKIDISTMFWSSVVVSIVVYIIIWFFAPLIADIYKEESLSLVLRVMALRIPIGAINSIQEAIVIRKMIFKKIFIATLSGTVFAAIIGLLLAFHGAGIWSLVVQYLLVVIVNTIVLHQLIKWTPEFLFSRERFQRLFSYSWKIMLSGFIGSLFDQLRSFFIGIVYTPSDLAYVAHGEKIPTLISNNVNVAMQSVLFPALSKIQDDPKQVRNALRKCMILGSYVLMPIMLILCAIAKPLVILLLTERWIACVPFLEVVCIQCCFSMLGTINMQAIKSLGYASVLLKLEIIKKPIYFIILLGTLYISPLAIVVGNAVYSFIGLCINAFPNKKNINYDIVSQLKDIAPNFFLSLLIFFILINSPEVFNSTAINLFYKTLLSGFVYIILSKILKLKGYGYAYETVKKLKDKGECYDRES